MVQDLLGTWHIHFTNFPMWLKGDKTEPSFHYTPGPDPDTIEDLVTYQKNGRQKSIVGRDTQIAPGSFRWRGRGLLALLSSHWQVTHMSENKSWAIIAFAPSLFTPAGHDIISRHKTLNPEEARQMTRTFQSLHPDTPIQSLRRKT